MYAKFEIKIENFEICAFKMMFSLIIFYWSALDGHSKREELEIFQMN